MVPKNSLKGYLSLPLTLQPKDLKSALFVSSFCTLNLILMAGFDDCVLYLSVSLIEMVCISDDVDLKPEGVFISPPPSDSGSSSPQLSPYCIDSEPGSPLLEHETVRHADSAPSINFQNRAQTPPLTSYSNNSTEFAPSLHIQIRAQASV